MAWEEEEESTQESLMSWRLSLKHTPLVRAGKVDTVPEHPALENKVITAVLPLTVIIVPPDVLEPKIALEAMHCPPARING